MEPAGSAGGYAVGSGTVRLMLRSIAGRVDASHPAYRAASSRGRIVAESPMRGGLGG